METTPGFSMKVFAAGVAAVLFFARPLADLAADTARSASFSVSRPARPHQPRAPAVMRSVRQCWYVLTRARAPLALSLGVLLFAGLPDAPGAAPPAVRVRIEVRDRDTGRFVAARFSLADRSGRPHTPAGVIAYHKGNERHFLAASPFEMELPPGRYRLTVARGAEYRATSVDLDAQAGQSHRVWLERWIDMNGRGWYSGDLHNHRRHDEMPILLAAEDLNLAPTITDWIWEDRSVALPPEVTDPIRRVDDRHVYSVLDKEVERLEAGPGAVALLGLTSVIPFDGYRLHPSDAVYARAARQQGGFVDAEKIVWRDGAALAALGLVDAVGIVHNHFNPHDVELETDRWGMIPKFRPEFGTVAGMPLWSMEVYYHLLNCGFRLPVSAGSASGVKASPLGYNRVYAKVSGAFSYQRWFAALKAGRSFATNGPMLFLTVDDRVPGDVLRVSNTAAVRIRAEALAPRPMERLEIVAGGHIIHTVVAPGASGRWAVEFDHVFTRDTWVAARAFEPAGPTIRFAHTSPVYVDVGMPASAAADAAFFLAWIDREMSLVKAAPGFRQPRHRDEMLAFYQEARDIYARMLTRRD
jgi:hypothetical protein